MFAVSGELSYRARIALPPESIAVVELRDVSIADAPSVVLAEQKIELKGRQAPIPFRLTVDRAKLSSGKRYSVRGVIHGPEERLLWTTTEAHPIDAAAESAQLGTLMMSQASPQAQPGQAARAGIVYRCGDRQVTARFDEASMRLSVGDEQLLLRTTPAASGAKYAAPDDPSTFFWTKGNGALLEIRGQPYPECAAAGAPGKVFTATGNEPGWKLEISATNITLLTNNGSTRIAAQRPVPEIAGDTRKYVTAGDGQPLTATIVDQRCSDNMSGMPHPNTVVVLFDGRELKGCGGDPAELLQGPEWVVEDINGGGIIDSSRGTLNFMADGAVAGRSFCNTYRGSYRLTGETLTIGQLMSTMMACAPSLTKQEKLFTDLLAHVRRFELGADGALILHTGDGRTITARRE